MKIIFTALLITVLAVWVSACEPETQPVESQDDISAISSEGAEYSPQPYSSLAQVMRGMNYKNSEIIFDTQREDPEQAAKEDSVTIGPSAELYGGWEGVENAALMLSEAANLMLIPGRLCENGLPAPVANADFRKYAQGLADAGQAAYEAAQTRDMAKFVEVSGVVSEACLSCHQVYRDKPEGTMRCTVDGALRN